MNDILYIVPVLLLGAIAYAIYLWRKVAMLEGNLRSNTRLLEETRSDAEKARADGKEKREEVDKLRKEHSKFEIKTPTSIVGVRGTTFAVEVENLK